MSLSPLPPKNDLQFIIFIFSPGERVGDKTFHFTVNTNASYEHISKELIVKKKLLLLARKDVFEIDSQAIPGHNHSVICLALILLHSILDYLIPNIL